jgi:glycosyltransferase involved in cell wall biosynthesis
MHQFPDILKEPAILCLLFLAFFTLIQLFYFWYYFARVSFFRNKNVTHDHKLPPISVVICARNEYDNLVNFLPTVLEQNYPEYEVIVVNDFSQDDSYFLLKSYEKSHPHFKVVHLHDNVNFFEGKKLALSIGIKSAKNDIIALIDADCKPTGPNWLRSISSGYNGSTEVVLGYGGYYPKPGLLNKLIRYDTMSIALQYLGMALAGSPYMGVGRNLSYRKSLFYRNKGFTSHYKVKSGDDDLFVNQAAKGNNTTVVMDSESLTFSEPETSFSSWFRQKKRHLTTGRYYKFPDKFRLVTYSFSGLMFYVTLAACLVLTKNPLFLIIAGTIFLIRALSLFLIYYYAGKRFLERKLFLYSPLFDIIFVILNPIFAISNLFYRKNKWK